LRPSHHGRGSRHPRALHETDETARASPPHNVLEKHNIDSDGLDAAAIHARLENASLDCHGGREAHLAAQADERRTGASHNVIHAGATYGGHGRDDLNRPEAGRARNARRGLIARDALQHDKRSKIQPLAMATMMQPSLRRLGDGRRAQGDTRGNDVRERQCSLLDIESTAATLARAA
jgi:hypothetical protein